MTPALSGRAAICVIIGTCALPLKRKTRVISTWGTGIGYFAGYRITTILHAHPLIARSVTIFTRVTLIHTIAIFTHITIFAAAGTALRLVKRARSVNAAIAAETLPGGGAGIGVGCAVSTGTSTVALVVAM